MHDFFTTRSADSMNVTGSQSHLAAVADPRFLVQRVVDQALSYASGGPLAWERRAEARRTLAVPLIATPADSNGQFDVENSIPAIGKNIGHRGIGFFTRHPINSRSTLVWLQTAPQSLIPVRVDLRWCRKSAVGWLEHGGYLLELWHGPPWPADVVRAAAQKSWHRVSPDL
ncbi:MAG: hypothetical protein KatS3mg110_3810 [Pirellulaceae bacterium]|nr:MAG: hypothetical protein KatS3mg110_3810 [Pirellulaceae bacterium]